MNVTATNAEPGLVFVTSFAFAPSPAALRDTVPGGQLEGLNVFGATDTTSFADAYVHVQFFATFPWDLLDPGVPNSGVSEEAPKAAFTAPALTAEHGSGDASCCGPAVAGETRSRPTPTRPAIAGARRRRKAVRVLIDAGL